MPDRPRYSRFRRLPGLYRIGEKRPADPHAEPQLLSLYMPGRTLDQAESLAIRAGGGSVQAYCEGMLRKAIDAEHRRVQAEEEDVRKGPLKSLDALADDPEYLAEWTATVRGRQQLGAESVVPISREPIEIPDPDEAAASARAIVLRHAGMEGEDAASFLYRLRQGIPPDAASAGELLDALVALEDASRDADRLDRRLSYALHRLAFEGQVLSTDGLAGASADPATIGLVRRVQEGVDRVLSGEDIRYYPGDEASAGQP